jgi:hypothetical protein
MMVLVVKREWRGEAEVGGTRTVLTIAGGEVDCLGWWMLPVARDRE